MAAILDGKHVASTLKSSLQHAVAQFVRNVKRSPSLAVILVGADPASTIYVQHKCHACQTIGITSHAYRLPAQTTETQLLQLINILNSAKDIDGILVQLPLPASIHTENIIAAIDPNKDVDGFHPYNIGCLAQQSSKARYKTLLRPCTPMGIMQLLDYYQLPIQQQHAVVVGTSNIVGRPMAFELLQRNATVTLCHRYTKNLQYHVEGANILIVATGVKDLIAPQWLNSGHIVIDVGIHRMSNGKLRGDLDFLAAQKQVAWITPVPGGVGPMTVISLLQNTLIAATRWRQQQESTA